MRLLSIASGSSVNCMYVGHEDTHLLIDTGISGDTANELAKKLAKIGKLHQVICVTHLAQVACFGDLHFYISKAEQEMEVVKVQYNYKAKIKGSGVKLQQDLINIQLKMKEEFDKEFLKILKEKKK